MSETNSTPDPSDREVYGDYSVDDEDQPAAEDLLLDRDVADEADRGYSPPEKYSPAQGYGNTPWEEAHRETIDQRERQEIPEPDPYVQAELEPSPDEVEGGQAGAERAGRLVAPDQGLTADTEKDLVGEDVGIDGAAASAEEAAVHVIDEDQL
ncbi:DUF5709 domain-containing protein [Nocardioides pantholopis]|uniref:DUF5709 domain-containing protein n=1 Tax=Nocardioides pantholopis TaxID=2483798 RepID=UPI000F08B9E1|nr:DUF5709 domain-containing protein [Nocardioides pantholopis]